MQSQTQAGVCSGEPVSGPVSRVADPPELKLTVSAFARQWQSLPHRTVRIGGDGLQRFQILQQSFFAGLVQSDSVFVS